MERGITIGVNRIIEGHASHEFDLFFREKILTKVSPLGWCLLCHLDLCQMLVHGSVVHVGVWHRESVDIVECVRHGGVPDVRRLNVEERRIQRVCDGGIYTKRIERVLVIK